MTNVSKWLNVDLACNSIECNSHETHKMYSNFNDRQQFRLSKINEIKYYFVAEIKEKELMNERLDTLKIKILLQ